VDLESLAGDALLLEPVLVAGAQHRIAEGSVLEQHAAALHRAQDAGEGGRALAGELGGVVEAAEADVAARQAGRCAKQLLERGRRTTCSTKNRSVSSDTECSSAMR
jgi:hypothetical protein